MKILEAFAPLVLAYLAWDWIFSKKSPLRKALTNIWKDSNEKADRIMPKQKKKKSVVEPVQIKFGPNHSKSSKTHHNNKKEQLDWDMPTLEEIGKEKPLSRTKTSSRRIQTFEEFSDPKLFGSTELKLDFKNGDQLVCNTESGNFWLNGVRITGAEIKNVMGMIDLGPSRVDGRNLFSLRIAGEDSLTLKINKIEKRFELIKKIEDVVPAFEGKPQHSNIDDWWTTGHKKNTVNGKIYGK